jgi:hypothetical protein
MNNYQKVFVIGMLIGILFICLAYMCSSCSSSLGSEAKPKFKLGEQVTVTLPSFERCSFGIVAGFDKFTTNGIVTYTYLVVDLNCPYDEEGKEVIKRICLIVNEVDLKSRYHTM